MSVVASGNLTVAFIRALARELCACPGENQLTTDYIDQTLNNIILTDFPYSIKLDQMRSVYTFYTRPYIDRYPLDVNYNQGVRTPAYVDGITAFFSKDRDDFFRLWPKWPTRFQPISGDSVTQSFTFTVPGQFLSNDVVLGGTDISGSAITVADDGNGNLQLQTPNPVVSVPPQTSPVPGMKNLNTMNPGQNIVTTIGSVNYVTGVCTVNFAPVNLTPAAGTTMTMRISQYQTGRPYSILFWNNEFTIRPVPKNIHRVEIETYLTPVQFMLSTDLPILSQWSEYLAYCIAIKVLQRRQDMAGVANLTPEWKRQESIALERQSIEEIGQRNRTIFSGATPQIDANNGFGQGYWGQ